jgi:hypothetical protein
MDYITEHYNYTYGISLFQLGLNSGIGLEYHILPNLAFDVGFEYEFALNFFGTYRSDRSFTHNYFLMFALLYKIK